MERCISARASDKPDVVRKVGACTIRSVLSIRIFERRKKERLQDRYDGCMLMTLRIRDSNSEGLSESV
jgi:hypothetical protein